MKQFRLGFLLALVSLVGCSDGQQDNTQIPDLGEAEPDEGVFPAPFTDGRKFYLESPEDGASIALLGPANCLDVEFRWRDNIVETPLAAVQLTDQEFFLCILEDGQNCDDEAYNARQGMLSTALGSGIVPHAIWRFRRWSSGAGVVIISPEPAEDDTYVYTFKPSIRARNGEWKLLQTLKWTLISCFPAGPTDGGQGLACTQPQQGNHAINFSTLLDDPAAGCSV